MKKVQVLLIYFLFFIISKNIVQGQEISAFKIKGSIYADNPINFDSSIIQLLKTDQKTIVKMEVAGSSGDFTLDRIPKGEYYLSISGPNIEKYLSSKIDLIKDLDLGKLKLTAKTTNLKEVSIAAAKPLIQQYYDKTVVNVANSITAVGSTALDVLIKSPGVAIDKDDNIAMRGRQGVLIMIDGKLVPMSGQDLATMLRNMPATQIDRIDLITNPSAKYDASGNSGIIDIHLKKDTRVGTNGTVTTSYGEGRYSKFNSGISLNNRTAKLNVFGSYNYSDRNTFNDLDIMRSFYDPNNLPLGGYNEHNYLKNASVSHSVRLGADYYITPKTIVGFVANGLYFKNNVLIDNSAVSLNNSGQDTSSFATGAHNSSKRDNNSINLNFKTSLDTLGKELTADADYASYDRTDLQSYITRYYNLQHVEDQAPYDLAGNLVGKLSIKSLKTDYTQPLGKNAKLELGLKSSWVVSDNNVNYFNQSNGGNVFDTTKSNHFIYNENINAAYANASDKWGKASLQFGLRVENTNTKGLQLTNNSSFTNDYTQLFPSGYFGYQLDKNNDVGVSLSRRVNRATYNQLNPFKIFLDPTTYIQGNPYLRPEVTESYEFNWTVLQKYTLKVGYSTSRDNIEMILSPDALNSNVVVEMPENIAKYNYYDLDLTIPLTVGKWFSSSNNAVFYYGKFIGIVANTVLNNGSVSYNLTTNNTFVLDSQWSGELNGAYQSKSNYGFQNIKSFGTIDMGIQKKLWSNKANLKLNMTDILYTGYARANTTLTGYKENFIQHNDTRVATISFTYKFGNGKVPAARRKVSGVEEEKRRAQS